MSEPTRDEQDPSENSPTRDHDGRGGGLLPWFIVVALATALVSWWFYPALFSRRAAALTRDSLLSMRDSLLSVIVADSGFNPRNVDLRVLHTVIEPYLGAALAYDDARLRLSWLATPNAYDSIPLPLPSDTTGKGGPTSSTAINEYLRCDTTIDGFVRGVLLGERAGQTRPLVNAFLLLEVMPESGLRVTSWARLGHLGDFTFRGIPQGEMRFIVISPEVEGMFYPMNVGEARWAYGHCLTKSAIRTVPVSSWHR